MSPRPRRVIGALWAPLNTFWTIKPSQVAHSVFRRDHMKRAISTFGLLAALLAVISLASYAADSSMSGWISDSHCGAKGMNAGHKTCAETCVKQNHASWVFVDSKDSKIYPIANQD